MPMNLSTVASACSEITVILAALAMLIKPIRNKLLGLDKLTESRAIPPTATPAARATAMACTAASASSRS